MSPVAQDLINRMIHIDPKNRLGHDLKSLSVLKQHPFFKGVDFGEVSKKKYKGVYQMLQAKVQNAIQNGQEHTLNLSMFPLFYNEAQPTVQFKPDEKGVILKGHLLKKNWMGNRQLRLFELYETG